jgi:hypothetical protein
MPAGGARELLRPARVAKPRNSVLLACEEPNVVAESGEPGEPAAKCNLALGADDCHLLGRLHARSEGRAEHDNAA